jgi:DNA gyrase/topoisomerase IV subunit A
MIGFTSENTDLNLIKDKIEFIGKVISGELDFKNKNKQQIKDELQLVTDNKETIEVLIRMPIYSLCQDEIDKLKKEGAALYEQIKKWKAIDVTEQFIKELEVI